MPQYLLRIELLSETTFGRGDGQAGEVDLEVQHDTMGLPYWSGRAVKGVLVNECADILAALGGERAPENFLKAAASLFGNAGSRLSDGSNVSFSEAHLPDDLVKLLNWQLQKRWGPIFEDQSATDKQKLERLEQQKLRFRGELLSTLTSERSQTRLEEDGSAAEGSLRTQRVLLSGLVFISTINTGKDLGKDEKGLLAACVKALRVIGSGRNRGRGQVKVEIYDNQREVTNNWFEFFKQGVPQ